MPKHRAGEDAKAPGAKGAAADKSNAPTVPEGVMETPARVYCLRCGKSYASNDGVRKHSKRYHAQWMAFMDANHKPVSGLEPPPGVVPPPAEPSRKRKRAKEGHKGEKRRAAAAAEPHVSARGVPRRAAAANVARAIRAAAHHADDASRSSRTESETTASEPSTPTAGAARDWTSPAPLEAAPAPTLPPTLPPRPTRPPSVPSMIDPMARISSGFWLNSLPPVKRGPSLAGEAFGAMAPPPPGPASRTPSLAAAGELFGGAITLTPSDRDLFSQELARRDQAVAGAADFPPALSEMPSGLTALSNGGALADQLLNDILCSQGASAPAADGAWTSSSQPLARRSLSGELAERGLV